MKPTRAQYFFASDWATWPLRVIFAILFIGVPLYFACIVALVLAHAHQPLSDFWNLVQVSFYTIIALAFAFLSVLVVGGVGLGLLALLLALLPSPLINMRSRKNGAPFVAGDYVQILSGRHKGRVAKIYGESPDGRLQVDLGEQEKAQSTDTFSAIQLLRENPPSDTSHPAPGTLS